jgi:hypothetical protein
MAARALKAFNATIIHSNLERWVALAWRGDLFAPPKGIPFGTHLATFLFCNQGKEIQGTTVRALPGVIRQTFPCQSE